jgi:hypothetical protein
VPRKRPRGSVLRHQPAPPTGSPGKPLTTSGGSTTWLAQVLPLSPPAGGLAVLQRYADPPRRAGQPRLAAPITKASHGHRGAGRTRRWLHAARASLDLYAGHPAVDFTGLTAEIAPRSACCALPAPSSPHAPPSARPATRPEPCHPRLVAARARRGRPPRPPAAMLPADRRQAGRSRATRPLAMRAVRPHRRHGAAWRSGHAGRHHRAVTRPGQPRQPRGANRGAGAWPAARPQ